MAAKKSDSFFVRAQNTLGTSFDEASIDIGFAVDALGESVLRIHNVQVQFLDSDNTLNPIEPNAQQTASANWQITTQSQSSLVAASDKSVIATGSLYSAGSDVATLDNAKMLSHDIDVNPQDWTNGYLVGVESLFFGGVRNGNWASGNMICSIVMECTTEKLSKAAAIALSLSQQ